MMSCLTCRSKDPVTSLELFMAMPRQVTVLLWGLNLAKSFPAIRSQIRMSLTPAEARRLPLGKNITDSTGLHTSKQKVKQYSRQPNLTFWYNVVPGDKRRVMTKNVAILADSLPLSASKHNTMFLKTWQHLLWVYFSCVSEPKQKQATS